MYDNVKPSLERLGALRGFIAAAIADADTGFSLGELNAEPFNLELAVAVNTEVIRAKRDAVRAMGLNERVHDILVTLEDQYHMIAPSSRHPHIFFYLVLHRDRANLALARLLMEQVSEGLVLEMKLNNAWRLLNVDVA